jgi:hypothetical protein
MAAHTLPQDKITSTKAPETEIARHARLIGELRAQLADDSLSDAQHDALEAEWIKHRHMLAGETSDSIADAAIKMGMLCRVLRSFLNPSLPGEAWAYRLAEGIHDDLESFGLPLPVLNVKRECAA